MEILWVVAKSCSTKRMVETCGNPRNTGMFTTVFNWCRIVQPSTVWCQSSSSEVFLKESQINYFVFSSKNWMNFHLRSRKWMRNQEMLRELNHISLEVQVNERPISRVVRIDLCIYIYIYIYLYIDGSKKGIRLWLLWFEDPCMGKRQGHNWKDTRRVFQILRNTDKCTTGALDCSRRIMSESFDGIKN